MSNWHIYGITPAGTFRYIDNNISESQAGTDLAALELSCEHRPGLYRDEDKFFACRLILNDGLSARPGFQNSRLYRLNMLNEFVPVCGRHF